MQKIVAGIKFSDTGDAVRNLQSALIALLDRNVINLGQPQVNQAAAKALRIEMEHGRYDKAANMRAGGGGFGGRVLVSPI